MAMNDGVTVSLLQMFERFPDAETARIYLEDQRWKGTPVCPHCGSMDKITVRKGKRLGYYRCRDCKGPEFTVRTASIFERSHVPLHKWIYAIYMVVTARKGVSSMQLSKEISVTQATAWFVLSRLREACGGDFDQLRGIVEVDETYIGGKRKNMPKSKRKQLDGRGAAGKTPVIGARERGGRVTAQPLKAPGMKTRELDAIASREIKRLGGKPAFKGYRGFPATICTSINQEIVHGIPGDQVINEGDLVKMDVGAVVDGLIGDAAITVGAGKISDEARNLIDVTRLSLEEGINAAREGGRVGDIGAAIQQFAEARGYSVVTEYVGHGVGRFLHEEPQVPNYGPAGRGALLRRGMTIAIEPMVNIGGSLTRLLDDQWTVVTADGSLSAHFEHTIAITDGEAEVLTIQR